MAKPHTLGEKLKFPLFNEVLITVLHMSPSDVIKNIHIRINTVKRWIYEMTENVKSYLNEYLKLPSFLYC